MQECIERFFSNVWGACFGFQICAICVTTAGSILSYRAEKYGSGLPIFSLGTGYFVAWISLVWKWHKSETKWWNAIFVTIFIVPGDILAMIGFSKTSLASAMLLTMTVVFWVAPLSYFYFKRKINWKQFIAILFGLGGVSMVLVAQGTKGSKFVGNMISLGASILFAFGSIYQEKCAKEDGPVLYICKFMTLAIPLTFGLSGGIEWKELKNYKWDKLSIGLQIAYAIAIGLVYLMMALVLPHSNATIMTLNNLTGNFYSLAIDILFFHRPFKWLYLLGFCMVPVAIIFFVFSETKSEESTSNLNEKPLLQP
ncbi:hypothetical protein TVAG_415430 [Trichomonas vaginalis G3]|uniref:Integral membrane protein n=1 Tax=Trichomonas vaginalis (strain ATCC PRA-98 / G3) TaxID=412133 RepID=A2EW73_TRIV3|nr:transmembrane transporter protein [Trichomonas vaginalis G3]EAY03109.1 hypothetical protein TVAG_415430 [Trichomonas vaginalis G3]KAI5513702.1 transmembrane transporter protein [Trichomonas vaginalis G3]|eukprot:XP_001315332.1 hypothetical protein [Trichomonas vaginalis G3]